MKPKYDMDFEKELHPENTVATIFTEGKTDWQHFKKAKEILQIDLNITFHEEKGNMGDSVLLQMCRMYSRFPQIRPFIFIFDRDKPNIIKEVSDKEKGYKDWGNNVFSFAIPVPVHRSRHENISVEFYYHDEEIQTKDYQNNRLFLSSEFDEKSGNHKDDLTIHVGDKVRIKNSTTEKMVKIVDRDIGVFNKTNQNIALSKSDFARYIYNGIEPFQNFDFEPFRKVFDVIAKIVQTAPAKSFSAQQEEHLKKLAKKHEIDFVSLKRLIQVEKKKSLLTRHSNIQQVIMQEIQQFFSTL